MSEELELAQQLEKFVDNLNQSDSKKVQKIRTDNKPELDGLFELAAGFKAATSQMPIKLSERARSAIFEKIYVTNSKPKTVVGTVPSHSNAPIVGAPKIRLLAPIRNWRKTALAGLGLVAMLAIAFVAISVLTISNNPDKPTPFPIFVAPQTTEPTSTSQNITGTLLTVLQGHTGDVRNLAWSPDGKLFASSSDDKTAKLWSADGKLVTTIPISTTDGVQWSPDGKSLLTPDGKLWDTQGSPKPAPPLHFYGWSPDGKILTFVNFDQNSINLQTPDGKLIAEFPNQMNLIQNIDWSPDSKSLAISGFEGAGKPFGPGDVRVWIWGIDGKLLGKITDYDRPIMAMAWLSDGKKLAVSSKGVSKDTINGDRPIKLWSADGKELTKLDGDYGAITGLAWSPDSKFVAGSADSNAILIWNAEGKLVATLLGKPGPFATSGNYYQSSFDCIGWSPDGKTLAAGSLDGTIQLFKMN